MRELLLVEDRDAHSKLIARALAKEPYRLQVATTLTEARQLLARFTPDLVLADLVLPDGRGLDLLPSDADSALFPIVVLTSHGDEATAVEAMKHGALDYIVKTNAVLADVARVVERTLREWGHIQEKRAAWKQLRENEERLRLVVSQIPAVLWTVDRDQQVTSCMGREPTAFGVPHDEAIGRPVTELFSQTDATVATARHARAVNGESADWDFGWKERRFVARAEPLRDTAGRIVGCVAMAVDNTERLLAEAELRGQQDRFAHISRLATAGQMMAELSHEVHQPLSTIANFAATTGHSLRELVRLVSNSRSGRVAELFSELQEWNQDVSEEAHRASAIVRRVLGFVRRKDSCDGQCDVHELLTECVKLVAFEAARLGVAVRTEFAAERPVLVADRLQIQQVVVNLLRNALDALRCPPPRAAAIQPNITVSTAADLGGVKSPDGVQFTVADNGPGLSEAAVRRWSEPFFTTKPDGIGLGLSISQTIVLAHGGRIWMESQRGEGAKFIVFLPRRANCQVEMKS